MGKLATPESGSATLLATRAVPERTAHRRRKTQTWGRGRRKSPVDMHLHLVANLHWHHPPCHSKKKKTETKRPCWEMGLCGGPTPNCTSCGGRVRPGAQASFLGHSEGWRHQRFLQFSHRDGQVLWVRHEVDALLCAPAQHRLCGQRGGRGRGRREVAGADDE